MRSEYDRFIEKVEKIPIAGCWLWIGTVNYWGYGHFYELNPKKIVKAHRKSYELYKGPIPDGMCVCHKCDVRSCVNPDHLFLGTHKDNVHDMINKGRHKGNRTKIVDKESLWENWLTYNGSISQRQYAKLVGVSQTVVNRTIRSKQ